MKLYDICYSCHNIEGKIKYRLEKDLPYYSKRYKKWKTLKKGMWSDGSTGGTDVASIAWWVHDDICNNWTWDDGTEISVWQSSVVLYDQLKEEKRSVRAIGWFMATYPWQIVKRPFRRKK